VGRAIVACARERNMTLPPAEDVQTVQGKGVTARVRGARLWIGSPRFLEDRNRNDEATRRKLDALSQSGHTVMAVGNQDHLIGFITVTDGIRSEAAQALQGLRETGVEHLVMLTGDNEKTARIIAQKAGIDEVHAGLLPEDKVAVVDALVSKYGRVAMVGDGVNDAPAMGRASLGIAMGAVGSDAAIETADIALMSDDLSRLPWLMRHARRTLTIIRQNIAFALGVKVLFVGMTFLGAASLWAAIAADMGASLLVIMNGLRLLRAETMHASPPHRVS
jgi:Cd2+/Zn2+-exporting ATPase